MRVVYLGRDLMIGSRIAAAADAAHADLTRVDHPADLPAPDEVDVVLVDWDARADTWGPELAAWRRSKQGNSSLRVILFGPHTDVDAHREARLAGIGPVMARSKLVTTLRGLVGMP